MRVNSVYDLVGMEITVHDGESEDPDDYFRDNLPTRYRATVVSAEHEPVASIRLFQPRNQKYLTLYPRHWEIRDAATGELITPSTAPAPPRDTLVHLSPDVTPQ